MFKRSENPALFDVIKYNYNSLAPKLCPPKNIIGEDVEVLTQSQLDEIDELRIQYKLNPEEENSCFDVTSLEGIEKLSNLKSLCLTGTAPKALLDSTNKMISDAQEKYSGEKLKKQLSIIEDIVQEQFNRNQIADLSPLQKCKGLEDLKIVGQKNLKELDLSCWPELKHVDIFHCLKLGKIDNIEKLNIKTDDLVTFYVAECDMLNNIPNIAQFVKKVDESHSRSEVHFPLNSYLYLTNRDKKLRDNDVFINSGKVWWGEPDYLVKTLQVELMKTRVEEILSVITKDSYNPIKKMAQAYRWICENKSYDFKSADKEKELIGKEEKKFFVERAVLSAKMRSAYYALWGKKTVCAGLSRLFNFFCAELGFAVDDVYCSIKRDNILSEKLTLTADHAISRVSLFNTKDKQFYYYYFDPTYDLYTEKSRDKCSHAFCLNHEEISRGPVMRIDYADDKNSPSLQGSLYKEGLLETEENIFSIKNYFKSKQINTRKKALIKKHELLNISNPYKVFDERSTDD